MPVPGIKRLSAFLEWTSQHPILGEYDPAQLTAIAQHYGVPTPFIDLTRSAEVALFFACLGTAHRREHAVVWAWKATELREAADIEILEQEIPDLWRLTSQSGVFARVSAEADLAALASMSLEIQNPGYDGRLRASDVFPVRKSYLETTLDEYFFKEGVDEGLKHFSQGYVVRLRTRSFPGAFKGGTLPELGTQSANLPARWRHRAAILRIPASGPVMTLDIRDSASKSASTIARAVEQHSLQEHRVDFRVVVFDDERKDQVVARQFNSTFDGLVAHPFTFGQRCVALFNTLRLAPSLLRDVGELEREATRLFGPLEAVALAASGAIPTAAFVSRKRLESALDPDVTCQLRPYYARIGAETPLELLCWTVDPLHAFRFEDFVALFAEQVIPTQVVSSCREALATGDTDSEDRDSYLPNIAFDPTTLVHFTPYDCRFRWPFSLEQDLRRVLFLYADMDAADVEGEVLEAWDAVEMTKRPFVLRMAGFDRDPRELWSIPEAMSLLGRFVAFGGISLLEVTTTLKPNTESFQHPLGAFECWAMLKRYEGEPMDAAPEEMWSRFRADLMESNERVDQVANESGRTRRASRLSRPSV